MPDITVFRAEADRLVRLPIQPDSLDDATKQTGHGVYASLRTYAGLRVFRITRQLDRMRSSADLLGLDFPLDNATLRALTRRALEQAAVDPARVRITVLHDDPSAAVIAVQPFVPPPAYLLEEGVKVGLAAAQRENARAKDSRWTEDRSALWAGQEDAYEIMMVDKKGHILEGLSSNFYAVLGGTLHTADDGVLAGVARSILLDVAAEVLPVQMEPVTTDDIPRLEAAMLTSSSRGVVPIRAIGEQAVPVSAVVRRLQEAYDARIEAEMEPL